KSTIPPFSVQAWVSMATGKNPAKHGVTDFWDPSAAKPQREFASSNSIQGETVWEILSRHGKRVGVVNVPVTYPPLKVNGYMISGLLTPRNKVDYTYPTELRAEILSAVGDYAADPYDPLSPNKRLLKEFLYWMRKREEANRYLLQKYPWDFFINVIQALDHLQHLFWHHLDPRHPYYTPGEAKRYTPLITECYRLADVIVGERLKMLDGGTTLFVISDHGFGPAHKWFHVNRFLAHLGLLVFQERGGSLFSSLLRKSGLTSQKVKEIVRRGDLFGFRRRVMGRGARIGFSKRVGGLLTSPIDWSRTKAYSGSPATQGIYINLQGREPGGIVERGREYEEIRDFIIDELSRLRDPDTEAPVVERAYRKEEIYNGPFLSQLPDVVFSLDGQPFLASDDASTGPFLERIPRNHLGGRHKPDGVFLALGADIREGGTIERARIIDVAPTILYAMGLPIPRDMDGKVLLETFAPKYREAQPIRYENVRSTEREGESEATYSEEEVAEIEERLKGLGYL
ncbi:MAG: alkaline phosphatase family protein, partial [Anaerolineae bacterium]